MCRGHHSSTAIHLYTVCIHCLIYYTMYMCTPYYAMHALSQIMFGVCVMLILLIPSRLIPSLFPSFLPYNLTLTGSANPLREVQLELILLQFIVPTLLEHGNCRAGLKFLIKSWADLSARILYVCIYNYFTLLHVVLKLLPFFFLFA